MGIISVQSRVAYGHVGNAAAVFPLQLLGFDVWPIDTTRLSNHLEHPRFTGSVFEPADVREIADGLIALGVPARCDAVLCGYLGHGAHGDVALDLALRAKAARPGAVFCLDPVMGDVGPGTYVSDTVIEFQRRHARDADILTPNAFELGILTGRTVTTPAEARRAARDLMGHDGAPGCVVVTSLTPEFGNGIANLAVTRDGTWTVAAPRHDSAVKGTGDVFAALFLGVYLASRSVPAALEHAASAVHGIMRAAAESGTDEMPLAASRNEITAPSRRFTARPFD